MRPGRGGDGPAQRGLGRRREHADGGKPGRAGGRHLAAGYRASRPPPPAPARAPRPPRRPAPTGPPARGPASTAVAKDGAEDQVIEAAAAPASTASSRACTERPIRNPGGAQRPHARRRHRFGPQVHAVRAGGQRHVEAVVHDARGRACRARPRHTGATSAVSGAPSRSRSRTCTRWTPARAAHATRSTSAVGAAGPRARSVIRQITGVTAGSRPAVGRRRQASTPAPTARPAREDLGDLADGGQHVDDAKPGDGAADVVAGEQRREAAARPARRSCGPSTRTTARPGGRTRLPGRTPPGAAASRGAALLERAAQPRHALRHVAVGRRVEVEIGEHVERPRPLADRARARPRARTSRRAAARARRSWPAWPVRATRRPRDRGRAGAAGGPAAPTPGTAAPGSRPRPSARRCVLELGRRWPRAASTRAGRIASARGAAAPVGRAPVPARAPARARSASTALARRLRLGLGSRLGSARARSAPARARRLDRLGSGGSAARRVVGSARRHRGSATSGTRPARRRGIVGSRRRRHQLAPDSGSPAASASVRRPDVGGGIGRGAAARARAATQRRQQRLGLGAPIGRHRDDALERAARLVVTPLGQRAARPAPAAGRR